MIQDSADSLTTPQGAQSPLPSPSDSEKDDAEDGGAAGRETRRRLVEWWESHYSSERMKLVVLGKGQCCCELNIAYHI